MNSIKLLQLLARKLQLGNPDKKAPHFKTQPAEEYLLLRGKDGYPDIWQLKKGICTSYYGGAIVDENNTFYGSFTAFPWGTEYHPISFLPYLGKIKYQLDAAIFLITPEASANYFHWVVDLLPRLLAIKQVFPEILTSHKIILHRSLERYQVESLNLIGIQQNNIIQIGNFELAYAKNIIVATYENKGFKFSEWKKNVLQKMLHDDFQSTSVKQKHKLYLLRGKQKKRNLIGEDLLVKHLLIEEFLIVDPSKLSFQEQISLFNNSQVIIALHGAALTNTIFCEEQTTVIEIRSTNHPPEFFSEIAEVCNLRFKMLQCLPSRIASNPHKANSQDLYFSETSLVELKHLARSFSNVTNVEESQFPESPKD